MSGARLRRPSGDGGSMVMGLLFFVLALTIVTTMLVGVTQYSIATSGEIGTRSVQTQYVSMRSQIVGALNKRDSGGGSPLTSDPLGTAPAPAEVCSSGGNEPAAAGATVTISKGLCSLVDPPEFIGRVPEPRITTDGSGNYQYDASFALRVNGSDKLPNFARKSYSVRAVATCVVGGYVQPSDGSSYLACSATTPSRSRYYVWNLVGAA